MIKAKTKIDFNQKALAKKAWRRMTPPLQRAASKITRSAKASIKKTEKKYAAPGEPPRTRGQRRSLKKAIMYHVDKQAGQAIIGPSGYTSGQTGHFHEFGGVQRIKGKRRKYKIGKVGPVDIREKYVTPPGKLKRGAKRTVKEGAAFVRLKNAAMVRRARSIDRALWPDADKWRRRIYPKRPFMWPAVQKNWRSLIEIFADTIP